MSTPPDIATKARKLPSENIPNFRLAIRKRRQLATALGLLFAAGLPTLQAADPPHLIPFQGHLARPMATDPTQFEPVPAGRYDVLFTLYAAPVGGESKVWGPERHSQLTVVNGLVNAILGSVIGFRDPVAANPNFFARPLYVGITVDADGNPNTADLELVPRQALLPVVYAMGAMRSDRLDGSDWRDFFVGTDTNGTFTAGATKARDAAKLDGYNWGQVFGGNGYPTNTILSDRIADHSISAQKIIAQTITAAELAPATITSNQIAPKSITEANLASSLTINSIIPPGTISAFGGSATNIPAGWLLCDGSARRTNDYPGLFAAIGTCWGTGNPAAADDFSLPDLRAMFLRGVNWARNDKWADIDWTNRVAQTATADIAEVGSYQAHQFQSHKHTVPNQSGGHEDLQSLADNVWVDELRSDQFVGAAGGNETRPNNAYVNYIIKY
jgi:microcystin-dependent protein